MSIEGDPLCRVCFNAAQMASQQIRATEEAYGLEVTGQARGLGGRMRKMGFALLIAGALITLMGLVGGKRILIVGVLTLVGGGSMIAAGRRQMS